MDRVVRARRLVRVEFAIVICAIGLAGLGYVALPAMSGGLGDRNAWWDDLIVPAGIAGVVIGFAWMIRIARAAPEPEPRDWRYRDVD